MAEADLRKVTRGQAFSVKASTYNAFVDAAKAFRDQALRQKSGTIPPDTKAGAVTIRNATGQPLDQYSVLALGAALITPQDNLRAFQSRPAFEGLLPASAASSLAIIQEPLAPGALGLALVSGISPARISSLVDETPPFAAPAAGEAGYLVGGTAGLARVLYRAPGTGEQWGLVQFPALGQDALLVRNAAAETIQDGFACRVTGIEAAGPVFLLAKPDGDSQLHVLPYSGPDLPPGQVGWVRLGPVLPFRLSGEAGPGDFIGTRAGQWTLQKSRFGFLALGSAVRGGVPYAFVLYTGLPPALRAVADQAGDTIAVAPVASTGETIGDPVDLAVIPEE